LPDMGRADARSAEINRPAGVARSFQVSLYKVEPTKSVLARNLLAKDDCRATLSDEVEEGRPKVPLVSKPSSFARRAERLARATTCPDFAIVWPSGPPQGVAPDTDSCEEVALSVGLEVIWRDIFDASFIHITGSDVPGFDQVAQPFRRIWVKLVVVSRHQTASQT
jgi:hypothetical protein